MWIVSRSLKVLWLAVGSSTGFGIHGVGQFSGPWKEDGWSQISRGECRLLVAKWMGVSCDHLATNFPCFKQFDCTGLAPAEEFQMKRCVDAAYLE